MSFKNTIIIIAIMLFTFVFLKFINHREEIKTDKPLSTFPKEIGQWKGTEGRFDQKIYDILGVNDSFLCNYRAAGGSDVQLYVGFYQSQKEGDLIHSPKNCMPGQGWDITNTSIAKVNIPGNSPSKINVIRLDLENNGDKEIVFYWYQSRGRFISSEYWQKIYLVIDSITKGRTDGSFVRLIAPVINGNEAKAVKDLKDFTRLVVPLLEKYLPS